MAGKTLRAIRKPQGRKPSAPVEVLAAGRKPHGLDAGSPHVEGHEATHLHGDPAITRSKAIQMACAQFIETGAADPLEERFAALEARVAALEEK